MLKSSSMQSVVIFTISTPELRQHVEVHIQQVLEATNMQPAWLGRPTSPQTIMQRSLGDDAAGDDWKSFPASQQGVRLAVLHSNTAACLC